MADVMEWEEQTTEDWILRTADGKRGLAHVRLGASGWAVHVAMADGSWQNCGAHGRLKDAKMAATALVVEQELAR